MQKVDNRSISLSAEEHLRQLAIKAVLDGNEQKEFPQVLAKLTVKGCEKGFIAPWPTSNWGKKAVRSNRV